MEAVRTSETSVDSHFTRQYIPEDNSELHSIYFTKRPTSDCEFSYHLLPYLKVVLGGLVISALVIGLKVCGFKPGRGR
jgi:hypothetical protein